MKTPLIRRILAYALKLSLILTLFPTAWHSAQAAVPVEEIDDMLEQIFVPEGPGAVFLVAKDGKPVYRKAFGKANLELAVDMTPENVFQIGSMTKQFTAVGILMLVEQGKLGFQDDVRKFMPDFPVQGERLTVHHLLTHTSGIKDFTKMKSIMSIARKDHEPQELINFFMNEPVDFLPGEQFQYSNSGYVVLGFIIEQVSGMSYADFMAQYIFTGLGMNHSRYASDRDLIKGRAYGYHDRDGFTNKMWVSLSIPFSSGSLMSTVDDLLIWQKALTDGSLVSPDILDKAFTRHQLNNGEWFDYGYGWHLRTLGDVQSREHGGSVFGFKSMAVYLPEQDIYVVGLSNCDCNSPTVVTREIAAWVLASYR